MRLFPQSPSPGRLSQPATRSRALLAASLVTTCLLNNATAQIAAWDFTGESTVATSAAEIFNTALDSSNNITRGAGATASAGGNSFRTAGFQNNGISTANTDFFQATLSAAPGFTLSLSTIDARLAGTAAYAASPGVSSQFAYSLDGTNFTLIGSPSVTIGSPATLPQIDLSGITALQNVADSVTVTLRYYASGQTTTGGWGFNSPASGNYGLAFGGSVVATGPVDTNPPELVSVSPADGTLGVLPNDNLTITYNENISQNAGGSIVIKDGAAIVETITLPSTRVTILGPTATINPTVILPPGPTYTVVFGGQPFRDAAGNLAPALTDETFWNFTTRAQPSVVINQYYEGSGTFDRYIELKNTTNSAVSLNGYRLTVWSNSSPSNNQDWKSGTATTDREVIFGDLVTIPSIAPNSTLLIANLNAVSPAYAATSANLKGNEVDEATFFSGDDSVVLYLGATNERANVVDAVSIVGSEGTNTSFYRLTDTPAFTFEIGSKLTDDLGQAWQQIDTASVDGAVSGNPIFLQAYVVPEPPALASFSIGNGAATAVTPRVTLNYTSTGGLPTQYIVSEDSNFAGASWTALPGTAPVIELSSGNVAKTLYFKIKNEFGESLPGNDSITRASFTNAGTVIFTQYYEGTSNNKYVEITNTSASAVDLSTWTLVRWGNAEAENWKITNIPSGSSSGVLNLSGTLAAGQTVVLANTGAASPVASGSAFIASSIINHTGNDSFGLYEGSVSTENLRDALSFTNLGNEGADKSFVRISAGTGFDFAAGTNITGFNTVWQEATLAVVNAATSNQKEFLGTYLDTVVQDYAAWIESFYDNETDPLVIGFDADPDFDGVPNGVEALIGAEPDAPSVFTASELTKTGNTFTFLYPQARVVPSGVTASYEWSTDLLNWYTTGQSNGVNTITLEGIIFDDDNVSPLIVYEVTATVTAGTATKLFVRVLAEN
jgi:Bacterial Ig-like domain/Lamin Tail Domain